MASETFDLANIKLELAPFGIQAAKNQWLAFFESFDQVGLQAVVSKKMRDSAANAYNRHKASLGGKEFKFGTAGGVFTIQRIK